jgi:hypothetical protein
MNLPRLRILYAGLLQLEYVLALIAGVVLGSGHWVIFVVCLALTLLLGFVTTWLYWKLMDKSIREK